jgi:hypothetical protein
MYNDVQSNQDGLLDIVTNRLKRRVHEILSAKPAGATDATATRTQSEEGNPTERPTASAPDPRQQLKALIERQIKKLDEKLKARDFSRLYSARLTYREIQGLRDFLDNKRYAMDIERYIQGSFVPRNHAQ